MSYDTILTEVKDGILTITINRPKQLNALNIQFFKELKAALTTYQSDELVKGVILTGSGPKAFAAGADIKEFAHFSVEEAKELSANGHNIFKLIETYPKPIIAAVNGFALGGGCELAMACHFRVASNNARFGQPEVNLGVIPGYGGTQRLIQLIGKGKAFELLMTGDMIKAPEALQLGLVNYVVAQEALIEQCTTLLHKISKKAPVAIAKVIQCVNAYFTDGVDGFETEITEFAACFATQDFKEGTTAFLEKRKAAFTGK